MNLRALMLAGLFGLPLIATSALAAETGNLSVVDAAKLGDRSALRALLNNRAKGDIAWPQGTAALSWAAYRNDVEMADLLLRAGADVNGANEYGATALYVAAANADPAMTVKLLAAGADANAHLLSGETPLMEAARRGNLATVRALLMGGANPNARESNGGQTALMWAASEGHAGVTEELLGRSADVNARSKGGFTALMFAAQQGDAGSARALLSARANPNDAAPRTGLTPLLIASAMGRMEMVALLLDAGADPNAVDAKGFTALHRAVRGEADRGVDPVLRAGAAAIVSALLAHGADPNIRLHQQKPTLTANYLSLAGATPLALAAEVNNLDAVRALVDGGADLHIPTEQNTTPLMLAAGAGTESSRPRAPEERATAVETVKFLVDRGAEVNTVGQFGWTALHSACMQGLNDVVEVLAAKGAKLDVKDSFGQTPLSIASGILTKDLGDNFYQGSRVYRKDTAELLLKLGATPLEQSGVVSVERRAGQIISVGGEGTERAGNGSR
jgi:ankyrin repeat protein